MTPAPAGQHYRTELIWAPDGGSEQRGWTLYVDGTLIANTCDDLLPAAAQQRAQAQLGGAVIWLPGALCWYLLAHLSQPGGGPR